MTREVKISDAAAICDIYNYYIANTTVTFEEKAVSESEMRERITQVTADYPWLVFESNGEVSAYAYLGQWHNRGAYRYTAESTIYVRPDAAGKGIGTQLFGELLKRSEKPAIHSIIGAISLPNEASVALHEKFGFKKVSHQYEVGYKFRRWIDVGYWQLLLDNADGGDWNK